MARPGHDEVVLLTGLPAFTARKVLEEILATSERALVHAIVRPKFADDARAALAELPASQRARVDIIEGDSAAMDLGLSGSEWRELTAEVDRIHHCAFVTYQGIERRIAEQVNVGGAKEIVELARACSSLRMLTFYSTAHVVGDRTGTVREGDVTEDEGSYASGALDRASASAASLLGRPRSSRGVYRNVIEETRARAERVVVAARDRLPISIVRPSIVVGDSRTGEVDRFDGPYLLMLMILGSPDVAMPLPGRGDLPLHLVPVDYVARAAVALSRDDRAAGKTFHLVDPSPLTARRVFERVALASGRAGPRGSIPANLARALLRTPGLERFAESPRAFLDALITKVDYDTTNTDALLEETAIRCPPFEAYADRIVDYVQTKTRELRMNETPALDDLPG